MRAGDVSDGVNHCEDNQTKRQGNSSVRNRAAAHVIDDDCARASENEGERSNTLGDQLFHRPLNGSAAMILFVMAALVKKLNATNQDGAVGILEIAVTLLLCYPISYAPH